MRSLYFPVQRAKLGFPRVDLLSMLCKAHTNCMIHYHNSDSAARIWLSNTSLTCLLSLILTQSWKESTVKPELKQFIY